MSTTPGNEVESITIDEMMERCRAQGVPTPRDYAFVCPACKTVQSMRSLMKAGMDKNAADHMMAYGCEGRHTGVGPIGGKSRKGIRGCDWSLGGLFRIHTLEIVYPDEPDRKPRPCFTIATPAQAMGLMAEMTE